VVFGSVEKERKKKGTRRRKNYKTPAAENTAATPYCVDTSELFESGIWPPRRLSQARHSVRMAKRATRATAPLSLAFAVAAVYLSPYLTYLTTVAAADEAPDRPRSLTPSNVLSGYSGSTIALSVNLRTANVCEDDTSFVDDEGFFCVSQAGEDCSRFFIDWNTAMDWQDRIISHCPESCNLCNLPDRTIFSLTKADGTTDDLFISGVQPDVAPSSFYGPTLSDPPEIVVSLNLVVPFPGCYTSSFISDPLERYAPLLAYESRRRPYPLPPHRRVGLQPPRFDDLLPKHLCPPSSSLSRH
jgi:hypothetical protein